MKELKPFEFPRIKREDADKANEKAKSDAKGNPEAPPKKPLPKAVPIPDPGLPRWEPDLQFEKADFAAKPADAKPRPVAKPVGTPARPDPRPLPSSTAAQPGAAPGRVITGSPVKPTPAAKPLPSPSPVQMSAADKLFRDTVIASAEKAVFLLRHWYWEKPAPPGAPQKHPVPAHDRIQIVLGSIGEGGLRGLFEIMTPKERGQMMEILRRPQRFRPAAIESVRRYFSDLLRDEPPA